MRLQRSAACHGFTLLELVVVMAIFAIFSLMAYGGLNSVLKTRAQVEEAQTRITDLQKAYLRLRNDVQQARFRPIRDGFGDPQPALYSGENGYLELTRGGWSNPLNLPRSSMERIAYRSEQGKLVRLSWRVLDRAQDSKMVETVLLDQVESVQWRFMNDQREWKNQWPDNITDRTQLALTPPPLAVELTLRLKDMDTLKFLFRIGEAYPAQALGTFQSSGSSGQTHTQGDLMPSPGTTAAPDSNMRDLN